MRGEPINPIWGRITVIAVILGIIGASVGGYVYVNIISANCTPKSSNPLIFDQPEQPDSMDPATTFSTPGWGAVQQIYQTLVAYNGTSYTNFSGVLAKNWTENAAGLNWNFTLWPDEYFANGDPINAYVMWYSLYRGLLMAQGPQFILEQNFFSPGVNYYSNLSSILAANATLLQQLNSWNFFSPTPSEIAIMGDRNQSFQVLNSTTLELNLGNGYLVLPSGAPVAYTYLLATISSPIGSAVDPQFVDTQAGGVVNGSANTYMNLVALGSGPYELLGTFNPAGTGLTLLPSTNYWGTAAAKLEPWNNAIQPAKAKIQLNTQGTETLAVNDLKTNSAVSASFAYLGPSSISQLQGDRCLIVTALPTIYGATSGSWWIFLNQSMAPFNNLSVREAVAHAINYTQIIQDAFGGYGQQWVGPVPPSYPYYNPQNLTPYSYNLALAKEEMQQSPWPNGYHGTIDYVYLDLGGWYQASVLIQLDLEKIGLDITLQPVPNVGQLLGLQVPVNGVCPTAVTGAFGGPFQMGQEFYTSDYISPDDWTQNDAISYGSANKCMAGYANATMDNLVIAAAGEHNATNLTNDYSEMTQLMYQNYTDIWLVVPTSFQIYNMNLQGVIPNPMASGLPFVMFFNTEST